MTDREQPEPASSGQTRLLVVIPTLNEERHIEALLRGLLAEARDSAWLAMTISVVDGGSTDSTCAIVRSLMLEAEQIKLLHNRARIQSTSVNLAVRRFGDAAEVLIRCDAHATYPEAYCTRLVQTLSRVGADSVVVPMDSVGERGLQRAVAWLSNSALGTGGAAHRGGRSSGFVDHGHHAAFSMSFFRRVGGYDETFTHNEDAELDCRQRALGARIYLDSDIRIEYRPRANLRALWAQYFNYGVGRSRTARRHPHSLRFRQMALPANLALSVLALSVSPYSTVFLCWPLLYLAVLVAASLRIAIHHRALLGLLAAPAAFTMHVAWAAGFFRGLWGHRERVWQREMAVPLAVAEVDRG